MFSHIFSLFNHNSWTNYPIKLKFELDLYFMILNNCTKYTDWITSFDPFSSYHRWTDRRRDGHIHMKPNRGYHMIPGHLVWRCIKTTNHLTDTQLQKHKWIRIRMDKTTTRHFLTLDNIWCRACSKSCLPFQSTFRFTLLVLYFLWRSCSILFICFVLLTSLSLFV